MDRGHKVARDSGIQGVLYQELGERREGSQPWIGSAAHPSVGNCRLACLCAQASSCRWRLLWGARSISSRCYLMEGRPIDEIRRHPGRHRGCGRSRGLCPGHRLFYGNSEDRRCCWHARHMPAAIGIVLSVAAPIVTLAETREDPIQKILDKHGGTYGLLK
ncbi:hypothetical protein PsYK624_062510 [Phanerochaete sordida]|uniref:Uncharacterized protein n=1 Tax=Phanerochaete sordida TaxID=48140 RepID=A0A9P3G6F1_9APHY|nr:hypothetical protein PsYK624_062510 [Phanerochaete sordida]